jgi:hypothetical protein
MVQVKCCTIADHTCINWKTHWTAAFTKIRNINCTTLGKAAFGANAAEEEHQAHQITMLLNNLANTLIQKNVMINNLATSNTQLAQALQEMQAAMVHMFPTGQLHSATYQALASYQPPAWLPNPPEAVAPPAVLPAPTQATKGPRPSYWGAVKPAWDKQGYCWSHGYKVKVGHMRATCSSRREGHQPGATRANTMRKNVFNQGYPFCYRAPPIAPT